MSNLQHPPYIIVQAGGRGSRMELLTTNRPKALVPVENRPMIFHLFERYPEAKFIVIGDYKGDVLEMYLNTFASEHRFIYVKAEGTGNVAGIKKALQYIPSGQPVLLVWSDLLPPPAWKQPCIAKGCSVGVVDFPCSWSLCDGQLRKERKQGHGVAGYFLFDEKKWLSDLAEEGSFTRWLQSQKDIPLLPLPLRGWKDVGTMEAYKRLESTRDRCRPYNRIEIGENHVIKLALTPEAAPLIDREVTWYERMEDWGFRAIPRLIHKDPLTLERIQGENIFLSELDEVGKRRTLEKLVEAVQQMHSFEKTPSCAWDFFDEYFAKTMKRLHSIRTALPYADADVIRINGEECCNILRCPQRLRKAVQRTLMNFPYYCPIHGDCQLTNTMVDKNGEVYFIDARGYFGHSKVLGDPRYDWAKIYYAIAGNFDQFNVKAFQVDISDSAPEVDFRIHSSGWEFLLTHFFSLAPGTEARAREIKLIHSIIWLSLASHAWEDFDSMCVAFYNGLYLFHKWEKTYE